MATDCDILGEIFSSFNLKPYWNGSNDCLEAKGDNEGNKIVTPDAVNQHIAKS